MTNATLKNDLQEAINSLGFLMPTDLVLSIPENSNFGDYTTNIALQLSKQNLKNKYHSSIEIANAIAEKLKHPLYLERVEVAGPGFLNFFIKDEYLLKELVKPLKTGDRKLDQIIFKKEIFEAPAERILLEFAQPNTHKPFHIGHFRNISIGESLSRLLEYSGVEVFRATYGGDIGPHVAKAIWGALKLADEYQKVKSGSLTEKAEFLGKAYVFGSEAYEKEPESKKLIEEINIKLYKKDSQYIGIWQETANWSKAYLDSLYQRLGTEFDAEIWESEVQEEGKEVVLKNLKTVFKEDQGAIIFPGEKYGLHNRVFITQKGYPTYEAKEIGLSRKEESLFPFDRAYYLVGNEQDEYFKVVTKAIELIDTHLQGKKKHLPFGMVNLSGGKMSSRKGNVITAEGLIEEVKQKIKESFGGSRESNNDNVLEKIAIGAIKFFMLKFGFASNIAFDINQSISLQGDTGPYVMYTYARTRSILSQSGEKEQSVNLNTGTLEQEERELLRQLEYFELVAEKAVKEFSPNDLTSYLITLAKAYNNFYQKYPIIKSEKAPLRLALTKKVGETLKLGLYLLGIEAVERM